MSDLTPLKGISQVDGLAAIEVLKEKISEEGYLFREPTDDVLVKKGRVWSSKDIQKFNTATDGILVVVSKEFSRSMF